MVALDQNERGVATLFRLVFALMASYGSFPTPTPTIRFFAYACTVPG